MPHGFVLQSSYRVEAGRPVVTVHGTLDGGESFLIRDTRTVPHFFVRRADAATARRQGARLADETIAWTTLGGEAATRVEVDLPADVPRLRDRLAAVGVECFESDVAPASRYLMDRRIRGGLEIDGPSAAGPHVHRVFRNPTVRPSGFVPRLRVLSLDIETDPRANRLLSVSLFGCGAEEVLVVRGDRTGPAGAGAVEVAGERELLVALERRIRELDPDVLTGWNVIDFDLASLARFAARCRLPLRLGRGPEPLRVGEPSGGRGPGRIGLAGRLVLDGIQLLRGSHVKLESYSLQSASMHVLGRGKTIRGADRLDEILDSYANDRPRFVEYNLQDARLVTEILERLQLVELAVERSRLTGLPPDRVGSSIAAFDFVYLSELSRRHVVAPDVRRPPVEIGSTAGGHVFSSHPGIYTNVFVLDFLSLYPSIIRTFQIDPFGLLGGADREPDAIEAPNGARFRRRQGILPTMLDELFPLREAAQRRGDRVASHAIKILMNSFYGVLGTGACRFGSADLANAITGFGREILLWTRARIEDRGFDVLYGDTDSLFVESGLADPDAAIRSGRQLAEELTSELAAHIARTWGTESRLELQFERLYLRLLFPVVRGGTIGARKRYAGLVRDGDERSVVFTGMEAVRRDWTDLARRVQRELYERLFSDRPIDEYLRQVVAELREGRMDSELVYRKMLRKRLEEYTATSPPHVVAARRSRSRRGRVVRYVMTQAGPEPADAPTAELDREHYLQKQVRPVAEPVLALLGLDFDRVIGDDAQLRLF